MDSLDTAAILAEQFPLSRRIVTVANSNLGWPYDGSGPVYYIRPVHRPVAFLPVAVDAYPGYGHDPAAVIRTAEAVEAAFPIGFKPAYYVLENETLARTNGHAGFYRLNGTAIGDAPDAYDAHIVLSGKRVPIHPAVTAYAVAHEYGHHVQFWIEWKRGLNVSNADSTPLDAEYARIRGAEIAAGYGGQHWHEGIKELIANDFRICAANIDPDYWPHPGFEHPLNLLKVQSFWNLMREVFACP